jgi:hypothetical protein
MKELLIESKTLPKKVEKFENYFGWEVNKLLSIYYLDPH